MTPDQFARAMVDLHDRASLLLGVRGGKLREQIADSISHCAPGIDERLARLHRQLTLVEIKHQLTRAECQAADLPN